MVGFHHLPEVSYNQSLQNHPRHLVHCILAVRRQSSIKARNQDPLKNLVYGLYHTEAIGIKVTLNSISEICYRKLQQLLQ